MIRAVITTPLGRSALLLGLSRENVRRLSDLGQPIRVDLDELIPNGPQPNEVVIVFGETEDAIVQEMRDAGLRGADLQDRRS